MATAALEDLCTAPLKTVIYENTYITEPEEGARFRPHPVSQLLRSLMTERLEGLAYDPVRGSQLVKQLADDIREKVKNMGFERYKLVVQVELGEKKGQAVSMVSRCLWDTNTDNFASEGYETETLFCNCQVYGLYFE